MQFPTLISGQLMQSTTVRSQPLQRWDHLFAGLGRQVHRRTAADRRVWRLRYENLNGDEAMRLRAFFESLPIQAFFTFKDPWTNTDFQNCRIRETGLAIECDRDGRHSVDMEIENAD